MKPFSVALAICLVIVALAGAAYFLLVKAPADAAENYARIAAKVADGIAERLHYRPTVTIHEKTEVYRNREVLEMAVIEGTTVQENRWQQEWMLSTKEIALRGTYKVKTGFSLDERFSIDLDPARKIATVRLPPPSVLSVEQIDLDVQESEGWWNNLTAADRQIALTDLQRKARLKASENAIALTEATDALKRRLDGFLTAQGWTVRYVALPPLPSPTAKP